MTTFLDTHAAIYLWEGELGRFGRTALTALETDDLLVSPIVRLELAYLKQLQKILPGPDEVLGDLSLRHGIALADDPVKEVIACALPIEWTRDLFDRLIVATAELHAAPLVTRDRLISANYPRAIW